MNGNTKGNPFTFAGTFVLLLLVTQDYTFTHRAGKQGHNQGCRKKSTRYHNYGNIHKRVNRVKIDNIISNLTTMLVMMHYPAGQKLSNQKRQYYALYCYFYPY
jgi:hypothetical protein